jgi:hypothetical protein
VTPTTTFISLIVARSKPASNSYPDAKSAPLDSARFL